MPAAAQYRSSALEHLLRDTLTSITGKLEPAGLILSILGSGNSDTYTTAREVLEVLAEKLAPEIRLPKDKQP
jgi:hypothetical protein